MPAGKLIAPSRHAAVHPRHGRQPSGDAAPAVWGSHCKLNMPRRVRL